MNKLSGLRTLVVEDNALLSMMLQDMLQDMGCIIVGATGDVDEAVTMARNLELDFGILDLNIDGKCSYPVADLLESRGVPFVFATGYSQSRFPDRFDPSVVIAKPFLAEELRQVMSRLLRN